MIGICSYAQNFEDVMLWRALAHVPAGFYVDIGAQDPVVDSVSKAFYDAGWRGVHVEPTMHYADLLREARPDEQVVVAAVSEAAGLMTFYEIPGTGLSTANADHAQRHRDDGFEVVERYAPSLSLDDLLSRYRDREIHWLKIDVEGFEEKVLRGWTLDTPRPWVVLVESTEPMTQNDASAAWEPVLLERGYRFAWFDGLNRFYVSSEHEELLPAFAAPPNVFDRFTLSGSASSSFTQALSSRVTDMQRQRDDERERRLAQADARADALQQELARRNAAFESMAQQVIADLKEHQRAQDASASELLATQRRAGDLARELTESHANVLHLRNAHADAERRASLATQERLAAHAAYESIRNSRSWRMTAPLRHLFGLIRRSGRVVVAAAKGALWLPRRAAKRVLAAGLAHVRAHPAHKAHVARLIRRSPRLDARLRRFAALNGAGGTRMAPPPLGEARPPARAPGAREQPSAAPGSPDTGADVGRELHRAVNEWTVGPRRNV